MGRRVEKGQCKEKDALIGEIELKLRCERGEKGKQKAPHREKDESKSINSGRN